MIDTSNHQKYAEVEANPVMRALMGRLFSQAQRRLDRFGGESLLDAGCGEGHVLQYLRVPAGYEGMDLNPACVAFCRSQYPDRPFHVRSVYALDVPDQAYDVVLCMEVLEHLERPVDALRELARVARIGVVLSVPLEPLFQLGNLARGKYRQAWGNHPEHIQHWGPRSFLRMLRESGVLDEVEVGAGGPWLVASGRPRR